MKAKAKTVVFWALIAACVVFLWRTTWQDPRGSLGTASFVVPLVVFVFWFLNRFTGSRRRTAAIMVDSAMGAVVAGLVLVWEFIRFQTGDREWKILAEAAIAGAILVACSSVSVWSFLRLRQRTEKVPT